MADKKSFKGNNPALSYISAAQDPEPIKEQPRADQIAEAPEGFRINPLYIESKSKRVQILMQPSTLKALRQRAQDLDISVNEAINRAVKDYLNKEA